MINTIKKVLRGIKHHLQEKNIKQLLVLTSKMDKKVDSLSKEIRELKKTLSIQKNNKLPSKSLPTHQQQSLEIEPKNVVIVAMEYLLERCIDRKLLVYGTGQEAKKISHYLSGKTHDVQIEYFLAEYTTDDSFEGKSVKSYVDIVYEAPNSVFVIVAEENECYGLLREKFINLGLYEDVDFTYYKDVPRYNETLYYDVTLSCNRIRDTILGFELFGDLNNPNACKIVALGGSTTDSMHSFVKGWAPLLADCFAKDGISVIMHCGGISAYTSTQELLKLIRDVIPLRPDIVLTYNGFNDLFLYPEKPCKQPEREDKPFITRFQVDFMNKVNKGNTVYYGIENKKSVSEFWLDNIRMMQSITEEFNILFLSFLQPFYHVGEYKLTQTQKAIFNRKGWSVNNPNANLMPKERLDFMIKGHQDMRAAAENIEYITDLTNIFSEHTNIYRDIVHVTEHGNSIIANNIYQKLKMCMKTALPNIA